MKSRFGIFLMIAGAILIAGAIALAGYNFYDSSKAEKASDAVMNELVALIEQNSKEQETEKLPEDHTDPDESTHAGEETDPPEHVAYPDMSMPTVIINGRSYIGYVEFPTLNLVLPVAGEKWNYDYLAETPCLYKGSVYKDSAIIAGHNYTAHFGRLDNLQKGAAVKFVDAKGNVFQYEVGWTELIDETDVEGLTGGDDWDMTLFTCNYSGDKRYTLRLIKN